MNLHSKLSSRLTFEKARQTPFAVCSAGVFWLCISVVRRHATTFAVCCSVLQYVVVCCSVLQCAHATTFAAHNDQSADVTPFAVYNDNSADVLLCTMAMARRLAAPFAVHIDYSAHYPICKLGYLAL